ncbi:MAG: hypothetical protein ACOC9E_03835, partial [Chloroflexota bacterium]
LILAKKEADRPITAEDYLTLDRFVASVEGLIIDHRAAGYEEVRRERAEAREQVPDAAWDLELEELDLPLSIHNLLLDQDLTSVGDVLYRLKLGDQFLLSIDGLDEDILETIHNRVAETEELWLEAEAEVEEEEEPVVAEEADVDELAVEEPVPTLGEQEEVEVAEVDEEALAPVAELEEAPAAEAVEEAEEEVEEEHVDEEEVPAIDDLSTSLVEPTKPKKETKKKKGKVVIVSRPGSDDEEEAEGEEDEEATEQRKGRQLVFDEDAGRVVTKRKRKGGRRRPEWEDFEDMDIDELLEDEY